MKFSKKFIVEISPMDAMCLMEFLNLIGKKYDVGDDLLACISRFISAVDFAGLRALDDDQLLTPFAFDILGSDGTGKSV